jgi:hypothetical protein
VVGVVDKHFGGVEGEAVAPQFAFVAPDMCIRGCLPSDAGFWGQFNGRSKLLITPLPRVQACDIERASKSEQISVSVIRTTGSRKDAVIPPPYFYGCGRPTQRF